MPLTSERFDPATSGRADPDRYLILGFDTEYQRYVDQPERRLENEVLSYQYSCIIAEHDGDAEGHYRWSGLVRPSGPEIDDRLTLIEFIVDPEQLHAFGTDAKSLANRG